MADEDPFAELRSHFGRDPRVEVASGRGAQGIKLGTKMFVMFYKGELLLKLPPERLCGRGHHVAGL